MLSPQQVATEPMGTGYNISRPKFIGQQVTSELVKTYYNIVRPKPIHLSVIFSTSDIKACGHN